MTKIDHYIRTARKAREAADDEVRDLERQRQRHRNLGQPTQIIDAELRRAREDRKLAKERVRTAERIA